jgi:hypothetical protein
MAAIAALIRRLPSGPPLLTRNKQLAFIEMNCAIRVTNNYETLVVPGLSRRDRSDFTMRA